MKYLFAIDIDGTLRNDEGIITEYSKDVIKEAISKGHYVVLCTARPRFHTIKVNEEIGASDYFICLSGAEVYDSKNNILIHESFIDNNEVKILYEYAKENDIRIMFSNDNKEYVTKFVRSNNQILLTDDNKDILKQKIKNSLIIDSNKEKVKAFENYIKEKYSMNILVSIDSGEESWFIVTSKQTSKGNGLKLLANHLKIDKNCIFAFGNDSNDISMFKEANKGYAVSNSTEDLINVASEVIDSNNNDGVAKKLKKIMEEF